MKEGHLDFEFQGRDDKDHFFSGCDTSTLHHRRDRIVPTRSGRILCCLLSTASEAYYMCLATSRYILIDAYDRPARDNGSSSSAYATGIRQYDSGPLGRSRCPLFPERDREPKLYMGLSHTILALLTNREASPATGTGCTDPYNTLPRLCVVSLPISAI